MSSFLAVITVLFPFIISYVNGGCYDSYRWYIDDDLSCEYDDEYCTAQNTKLEWPNPSKPEDGYKSWGERMSYACNSQPYCEWAKMWGHKCISLYLPQKEVPAAIYNKQTKSCSVIYPLITINQTISCCQDSFDCNQVFQDINNEPKEKSTYAYKECVERPELIEIVESIADCYATVDFMKCMLSNPSKSVLTNLYKQ